MNPDIFVLAFTVYLSSWRALFAQLTVLANWIKFGAILRGCVCEKNVRKCTWRSGMLYLKKWKKWKSKKNEFIFPWKHWQQN